MKQQIFEVQTWRQVRGPAGAAMCGTRDLGIKWPQWHTLTIERQGGHEVGLPARCKEDALETGRTILWRKRS